MLLMHSMLLPHNILPITPSHTTHLQTAGAIIYGRLLLVFLCLNTRLGTTRPQKELKKNLNSLLVDRTFD